MGNVGRVNPPDGYLLDMKTQCYFKKHYEKDAEGNDFVIIDWFKMPEGEKTIGRWPIDKTTGKAVVSEEYQVPKDLSPFQIFIQGYPNRKVLLLTLGMAGISFVICLIALAILL